MEFVNTKQMRPILESANMQKLSRLMKPRNRWIVQRWLRGDRVTVIAEENGISSTRVYQIIQLAGLFVQSKWFYLEPLDMRGVA